MNITRFFFQNYRSFNQAQEFYPNPGLNIIVGQNDAGKSNIFKVINEIIEPFNIFRTEGNIFFKGTKNEGKFCSVTLPIPSDLYEQFKESYLAGNYPLDHFELLFSKDIDIEMYRDKNSIIREIWIGQVRIESKVYTKKQATVGKLILPKLNLSQEWIEFASNHNTDYMDYTQRFIRKIKEKIGVIQSEISNIIELFETSVFNFSEIRQRPDKPAVDAISNKDFSPSGSQIGDILFRLQNSGNSINRKKCNNIKDAFHVLFPRYELIVIKEGNQVEIQVEVQDNENEENPFVLPIISLGTGVIELLIFLVNLIATEDKIFILEEPELHLHPINQLKLLNLINQYKNNNQIFIITHSPYFICSEDITSNVHVRMENGASKIIQPISEDGSSLLSSELLLKIQKELEYENFENLNIFFAQAVLLVEGPTEKGGIPIIANVLDKSFFQNNIYIAKVNGYPNFKLYYKLLEAFHIPCLILADNDAKKFLKDIPSKDKYILSTDFEGVIMGKYEELYNEATKKFKGKPLRAKWAINQMVQNKKPIPKEFKELIDKIYQKII